MHVIKTIKFDLPIDGVKVKNVEELRDHFTIEVLELYQNGLLLKWLRSRNMVEEVSQLESLSKTLSRVQLMTALCEVFKIGTDDMIIAAALGMPPEKMAKNFPELKQQYRTIAYNEAKATWLAEEEKKPVIMEHYLVYKNGTVKDTKTHLMWKQEPEVGEYIWDNAMQQFGSNVSFAGYDDWRMPTMDELKTLLSEDGSEELNQKVFRGLSGTFWSASPYVGNGYGAWVVHFDYGSDGWYGKYDACQVRLVRSGQ